MIGNRDLLQGESIPDVEKQKLDAQTWQIRWNFKPIPATIDMPASIEYEYVNVNELSKKAIKKAIILSHYDHDDEIGIINDQAVNPEAYQAYQDLRDLADKVIKKILYNGAVQRFCAKKVNARRKKSWR